MWVVCGVPALKVLLVLSSLGREIPFKPLASLNSTSPAQENRSLVDAPPCGCCAECCRIDDRDVLGEGGGRGP